MQYLTATFSADLKGWKNSCQASIKYLPPDILNIVCNNLSRYKFKV